MISDKIIAICFCLLLFISLQAVCAVEEYVTHHELSCQILDPKSLSNDTAEEALAQIERQIETKLEAISGVLGEDEAEALYADVSKNPSLFLNKKQKSIRELAESAIAKRNALFDVAKCITLKSVGDETKEIQERLLGKGMSPVKMEHISLQIFKKIEELELIHDSKQQAVSHDIHLTRNRDECKADEAEEALAQIERQIETKLEAISGVLGEDEAVALYADISKNPSLFLNKKQKSIRELAESEIAKRNAILGVAESATLKSVGDETKEIQERLLGKGMSTMEIQYISLQIFKKIEEQNLQYGNIDLSNKVALGKDIVSYKAQIDSKILETLKELQTEAQKTTRINPIINVDKNIIITENNLAKKQTDEETNLSQEKTFSNPPKSGVLTQILQIENATTEMSLEDQELANKLMDKVTVFIDKDPEEESNNEILKRGLNKDGTILSLQRFYIGDDGLISLAEALGKLSKLERIYLGDNNIWANGVTALAGVLGNFTHLQAFDLVSFIS